MGTDLRFSRRNLGVLSQDGPSNIRGAQHGQGLVEHQPPQSIEFPVFRGQRSHPRTYGSMGLTVDHSNHSAGDNGSSLAPERIRAALACTFRSAAPETRLTVDPVAHRPRSRSASPDRRCVNWLPSTDNREGGNRLSVVAGCRS